MKLADWRRARGWTQQQLADELDCVLPTVARYEGAARIPEQPTMIRIYVLTEGRVEPNDFYDLPQLQPSLALVHERDAA